MVKDICLLRVKKMRRWIIMLEKVSDAEGEIENYRGKKYFKVGRKAAWRGVRGDAKHLRPVQENIHSCRAVKIKVTT